MLQETFGQDGRLEKGKVLLGHLKQPCFVSFANIFQVQMRQVLWSSEDLGDSIHHLPHRALDGGPPSMHNQAAKLMFELGSTFRLLSLSFDSPVIFFQALTPLNQAFYP